MKRRRRLRTGLYGETVVVCGGGLVAGDERKASKAMFGGAIMK